MPSWMGVCAHYRRIPSTLSRQSLQLATHWDFCRRSFGRIFLEAINGSGLSPLCSFRLEEKHNALHFFPVFSPDGRRPHALQRFLHQPSSKLPPWPPGEPEEAHPPCLPSVHFLLGHLRSRRKRRPGWWVLRQMTSKNHGRHHVSCGGFVKWLESIQEKNLTSRKKPGRYAIGGFMSSNLQARTMTSHSQRHLDLLIKLVTPFSGKFVLKWQLTLSCLHLLSSPPPLPLFIAYCLSPIMWTWFGISAS